jgi:hypothetical protein
MYHHKSHNIRIDNKYLKNVADIKYFGTAVTNPNCIPKVIRSRLNSWKACYHSAQNILSSHLLSKNKENYHIQSNNFACGFIFIYGLFSNSVNSSYYRASNGQED